MRQAQIYAPSYAPAYKCLCNRYALVHKTVLSWLISLFMWIRVHSWFKPQMDTDKHRLDKTTEHTEYAEKEKSNSVFSVYSVVKNIALSVAPKLFIQAEHGAFVAERFYTTGWIKIEIENGEFR